MRIGIVADPFQNKNLKGGWASLLILAKAVIRKLSPFIPESCLRQREEPDHLHECRAVF